MSRSQRAVVVLGITYIAAIGLLFVRGAGILAAYLTMPAWLLVGTLTLWLPPGSTFDSAASSWTGNLVLLLVSATINVAGVFVVARLVSKGAI